MLKFLTGSAAPYLAGGMLLVIIALGLSTWIQTLRVSQFKAKYTLAQSNLKAAVDINAGNQGAIDLLETSLEAWKLGAETSAREQAGLAAELQQQASQLSHASAQLAIKESSDHALPNCQKLEALDLGVCPAHVAVIRLRSASGIPGPGSQ